MPAKKKSKSPVKKTYLESRPELVKRFMSAIQQGATIENAAGFAGLGVSTIFYWLQRGQEDKEGIYHKFFKDYKKAKSSLMLKHLMIINKAAENDWRASRYVLESQFGLVPQYKPEVEINISVDQVDTKELIEQLRKTDELLNLKGPIIDIQEE